MKKHMYFKAWVDHAILTLGLVLCLIAEYLVWAKNLIVAPLGILGILIVILLLQVKYGRYFNEV